MLFFQKNFFIIKILNKCEKIFGNCKKCFTFAIRFNKIFISAIETSISRGGAVGSSPGS